ncbi:DUF6306 domain-containing protein [Bacillus sp. Marseille-P3661]|uniref:DUF6306 domain-containing protein n=1 Tax=Bacillus sp. Marseille-P3661 TaxID=1936234 RepID=UPI000C85130B|nr:DUF6306 domain-containing protein [Bacillus sp. Marseille-P3661]
MEKMFLLLNSLLEAERAGVQTMDYLLKNCSTDQLEGRFKHVKSDEAWSCAGLHDAIIREGGVPTKETGDFTEKVKSQNTLEEKLTLLNKGQSWVARKIDEVLEFELHEETRLFLIEMKTKHNENIANMEEYLSSK